MRVLFPFRVESPLKSADKRKIMTNKPTRAPAKKKQPAARQTSESIAELTRLYLKSGKKIQYIEPGVSGLPPTVAKKPISQDNKKKTS